MFFSVDGEGGRRVKKWLFCVDVTNIWPLDCNIAQHHVQFRASSKALTSGPRATDRIRSTDWATDHAQSAADHTAALEKKRARITFSDPFMLSFYHFLRFILSFCNFIIFKGFFLIFQSHLDYKPIWLLIPGRNFYRLNNEITSISFDPTVAFFV